MSQLSGLADEQRTKRSAKKPAWMTNDDVLIDPAEAETEVKMPRPQARKPHPAAQSMAPHMMPVHHEVLMQRPMRPSGRMCSNPQCKNPFDSPQWRRGPLGPGTLCNACGTRYARLQAKMNGDKRGKMRPQERAEWDAFEQQRINPQVPQHQHQTWRMHMQHFVHEQQQQQAYYGHEQEEYAGYDDSDGYGVYDERSYGSQQQGAAASLRHSSQQLYGGGMEEDMHDPEATEDGQLMCQEGNPDSPDVGSRAAVAAAVAAAAAAAAAAGAQRPSSRNVWRGNRQHFPAADAATDSQEDEAAAYSCQDTPAAADAAAAAAASPTAPSFLHLLAVGEAMIKTEGVAPQDRRAAWTEVVGKGLGPEPDKVPAARAPGGEAAQGVKRSRFALEAEEQQGGGRPASSSAAQEPTALQRALERFGGQQAAPPQRAKPAATGGDGPAMPTDRFERLLAEAEACVRARSVSPCMLKGMPGGASPTCNMPAPRPITPLQLGLNAVDAAASGRGVSRSLLGVEMASQSEGQHGLAAFMLPGAAVPRRPHSAAAAEGSSSRGRHSSLAQALAAAAAAEAESPDAGDDATAEGGGQQDSPASQLDSNAGSLANRGDAARAAAGHDDVDADVDALGGGSAAVDAAAAAAAAAGYQATDYGAYAMQEHYEALMSQMRGAQPATEPSPMSRMLMADEVLSPTTMGMGGSSHARPRKQARTQGPAAMGVGAGGSGSSQLRQLQPRGDRGRNAAAHGADSGQIDAAAAAAAVGYQPAHLMAQQWPGMHPMLMHQDSTGQQLQYQQHQGVATAGSGSLPSAAELQQAGHHPVMLACQLVLQQQANPNAHMFQGQGGCTDAAAAQANTQGAAANAELMNSALQLAQAGGSGNAQTHLDQLKAVTLSAQAAAATASAVAAATELLWRQLQQQERERERQREREREQQQQLQQQQSNSQGAAQDAGEQQEQHVPAADVDAGVVDVVVDGAGDVDAAAAEPAAPGSPVADPAAAQAASGSVSRSSSSSTSAAGLSAAAPGDSQSVDKQAVTQPAGSEQAQQQQQQQAQQQEQGPSAAVSPAGADPMAVDGFVDAPAPAAGTCAPDTAATTTDLAAGDGGATAGGGGGAGGGGHAAAAPADETEQLAQPTAHLSTDV